jgi:hypothetical protein
MVKKLQNPTSRSDESPSLLMPATMFPHTIFILEMKTGHLNTTIYLNCSPDLFELNPPEPFLNSRNGFLSSLT